MTETEIKKQFAVDPASTISLREQLQAKFYQFVKNAEPETLLPPERTLKRVLGISRVTIRNALMPLYRKGLLVRNTRQGTRIAPRMQQNVSGQHQSYQMALGTFPMEPSENLTLLLYENIPAQQNFWNYTVNSFNSLYPKYHISILWLPENVSWKQYGAYLSATAPDLFQYEFYFDASEFALQFSEGFRKTFTGKHFFFCEKQRPHSLLYAFSCAMTYWNQSLAEKYGLSDVRKRLRSGDYLGLLEEALQKIPEPYRIAGHVWDYLDGLGYPPGKPLLQRQFLETQLGRLLRFSGNLRAFYISQTDSLDAVRNFAHGHQLSVDTSPAAWQMLQPHASFKVECEPVHPLPRYHRGCSGLPISINKKCRYPATAELFLEHLLSEAVQRQLTLRRHLIPVRRSAWYYGAEQMFQMQEPAANLLIGQLDCKFSPSLKRFLTYAILDDLADLLERKVKLNLVLDQIMLKWEQYQKHK